MGATLGGAGLLVGLVGFLDFWTGTEVRVFPLYFLPLAVVSARLGRWPGMACAALCAAVWLGSNRLAGMASSSANVTAVNTAVMLLTFVFVALLIAAQSRHLERERALARSDALTGLANSRGFSERAAVELARCARYRHPLTLAYLDIDDFKRVNDRLGHSAGDELLASLGRSLAGATRTSDVVGRLGGDEFAILLPEIGPDTAPAALARLKDALDSSMAPPGWPVTLSIGAVAFQHPPGDLDSLVRRADELMYAAKASGKNSIRFEIAVTP